MPIATNRIDLDASSHITVDWTAGGYDWQEQSWRLRARCRLHRSTALHSGVRVATEPLGQEVEIEVLAPDLPGAVQNMVHEAVRRCAPVRGLT